MSYVFVFIVGFLAGACAGALALSWQIDRLLGKP